MTVEAGNDELVGTGGDVPDVGEEVACVAGYWCKGECLSRKARYSAVSGKKW